MGLITVGNSSYSVDKKLIGKIHGFAGGVLSFFHKANFFSQLLELHSCPQFEMYQM